MARIYGFDMDGVVVNNDWRNFLLKEIPINWDLYHSLSTQDHPHQPMVDLVRSLGVADGNRVEIWTARPEKFRGITHAWLDVHNIHQGIHFDRLLMRPDGDWRPAHVIKCAWLQQAHDAGQEIGLVFDDSTKIVKAMQALNIGMICQVNHRDN